MKSFLLIILVALAAPWAQAQQMRVKTVDDGTVTFDIKSVNRIVFSDGDTLIAPQATTYLKLGGNLKANTGPFFRQSVPWQIQDIDGNRIDISISFVKTYSDMWEWTMTDLTNAGIIENGVLEINNEGIVLTSVTIAGMAQVNYMIPGGAIVPVVLDLPPVAINVIEDTAAFAYTVSNNGSANAYTCSYTPDFYDVTTAVYDEFGAAHHLTLRFEEIIPRPYQFATWSWEVWLATDVNPESSLLSLTGMPGFQGNGYLDFMGTSFRTNMTYNDIAIAPNSLAAGIRIGLDLSGLKQYSTAFSTDEVTQDGHGAY